MGVDITHLPKDVRNTIASFFLENMIFSKEEIETIFRASLEKKGGCRRLNTEKDKTKKNHSKGAGSSSKFR